MQEFMNFCLENYRLICDGVAILILIILFFAKKRPVKDITSVIFEACLKAVTSAEKTALFGKNKLSYAVNLVKKELDKVYPDLDVSRYVSYIEKVIENILETPQKH